MHVIPIAGGDPNSLCRFWLVLWLCVFCLFGLLCCFWFAFLSVFLLGQLLDCVLVRNRHFCGFRQVDSPACKLQFNCLPRLNVCNDLAEAMKALDGKKGPYKVSWRPDGSVGMVLVLPALTDCRWWFESLLAHSGVSSATRRKATGADHKKKFQALSRAPSCGAYRNACSR